MLNIVGQYGIIWLSNKGKSLRGGSHFQQEVAFYGI